MKVSEIIISDHIFDIKNIEKPQNVDIVLSKVF